MDIYKISDEIIKYYSSWYSSGEDRVSVDEKRIQYVFQDYYEEVVIQYHVD
jgi:hypothetical protein